MNEWSKNIKSSFLGTSSSRDFRNNFLQIWKWGNEVWKLSSLFYNGARTRTHCSQENIEDETISSIAGASSAEYHTLSPAAGGHKSQRMWISTSCWWGGRNKTLVASLVCLYNINILPQTLEILLSCWSSQSCFWSENILEYCENADNNSTQQLSIIYKQ